MTPDTDTPVDHRGDLPGALLAPTGSGPVRLVSILVVIALVVLSAVQVVVARNDRFPSDAAFKVEGHVTTVKEFNHLATVLTALYQLDRPKDPSKLAAFDQAVAKALAVGDILEHEAGQRGITISDKAVDDQLSSLISSDFPTGNAQAEFAARLKQLGISQADVTGQIRQELATSALYSKITGSVATPSTAAAQAYYNTNKAGIKSPEQRHLANIVVATQAQAAQILSQLQAGTSFASLAQADSLDGSTKNSGGDVGTVAQSQLETGYGDAAFAAPSGGFFGPVQTQYGWNVGQVISITPSAPLSFAQSESQIKQAIKQVAQEKVWNGWIVKQIKAADVHYAKAYRPANPDAAPTGQPGAG